MYKCMKERKNVCTKERTHERTNARTHERTNARTHERTNARTHERTNARTNERTVVFSDCWDFTTHVVITVIWVVRCSLEVNAPVKLRLIKARCRFAAVTQCWQALTLDGLKTHRFVRNYGCINSL